MIDCTLSTKFILLWGRLVSVISVHIFLSEKHLSKHDRVVLTFIPHRKE